MLGIRERDRRGETASGGRWLEVVVVGGERLARPSAWRGRQGDAGSYAPVATTHPFKHQESRVF